MGLRIQLCYYSSLYLSIFYPIFLVFVFRLLRIRVTVFFATYLLLHIYSSALLKQCSGAIVRFSDSSSFYLLEGIENCKMSGKNQGKVREF